MTWYGTILGISKSYHSDKLHADCGLMSQLQQICFKILMFDEAAAIWNKLGTAAATICPRHSPPSVGAEAPCAAEPTAPADGNVAVGLCSPAQYVPTLTAAAAWRVNAAVSKAAWWPWPLTFWPWKWCLSHMWHGLPLCQLFLVPIGLSFLDLGPMYATDVRRQTDRRQTASSLNATAY